AADPLELDPLRRDDGGDLLAAAPASGAGAPLKRNTVPRRDDDVGELRAGSRGSAHHDAGLGPGIRITHAGDAGSDDRIARETLGGKIELIRRVPDIRAAPGDGPISA